MQCRGILTRMSASQINARSLPRLGSAIRALRRRRKLTQAELASAAGVSRQWVVSAESGTVEGLELARVMRVLDVLDTSLWVHDDLAEEA